MKIICMVQIEVESDSELDAIRFLADLLGPPNEITDTHLVSVERIEDAPIQSNSNISSAGGGREGS